jgi:hypothetical protein
VEQYAKWRRDESQMGQGSAQPYEHAEVSCFE